MDMVILILIVAAIAEAVVESIQIVVDDPKQWKPYAGFAVGAGCAVAFGVNVVGYLGLSTAGSGWMITALNALLMGALILRHSGNVNKILEFLKYLKGLGVAAADNYG